MDFKHLHDSIIKFSNVPYNETERKEIRNMLEDRQKLRVQRADAKRELKKRKRK